MEVRYVPWAIANNFGDYIEINEHLREYPDLHKSILEHELAHTNQPGFTKKDFLLDLGTSNVNYSKLFFFMIRHPKSFLQFAPFYKKGDTFFYDINMTIAWVMVISVISIGIYIGIKI